MTEPNQSGGEPDSASALICPWCSAPLKTAREASCPSCGAALHEAMESEVPGVTRVDHEAILRARTPGQRSRSLVGWLSGEYAADATPASLEGIAPPDDAVRREMIRLEVAALQAEAQAAQAEAAAELAEARGLNLAASEDSDPEASIDAPEPPADPAADNPEGDPATPTPG